MSSTETKVAGARGKSVSDREDDDWETDPDYVNTMTEEEQRWGGARDTGVLDMEELRAEVRAEDRAAGERRGREEPGYTYTRHTNIWLKSQRKMRLLSRRRNSLLKFCQK